MRILFMGTPSFAVPSLERVGESFNIVGVVTQPDRPAGRGKRLKPPPVKERALELGYRVFQPERIKDFVEEIRELKPDCIVVVAYGKILPKEILELPPYRVINLHASLLPKYRGAAPIQRAIMVGERETGNTVMLVNERMDAGDILSQERVPIGEDEDAQSLSRRLSVKGANLLVSTLKLWFEGKVKPVPQKEEKATYAPPIQKEEFRVCWKAEARSVKDRVRALYPGAFFFYRENRVKLLRVKVVSDYGEPGEVIDEKNFVIACGRGAVQVLELISPKGRRMSGEEFLRGYPLSKGELLK